MFRTKVVGKIKTHILCSVIFFFANLAFCEIMWKNVGWVKPQITVWRMRLGLQTHTQIVNTHCFSIITTVARTRLSVMLYVQCLSCLVLV